MSSNLLTDKKPIVINRELAELVGLNESIVLQQINYWVEDINKKKGEQSINYQDGYYWTFNSYKEWQKQFPFWSKSTVRRTIKKLEKRKLIETANYNRMKIDRTKWYRIKHKNLDELRHYADVHNEQFKWSEWVNHVSNLDSTIPEITSESTSENTEYIREDVPSSYQFNSDKVQNLLRNNYPDRIDLIRDNVYYYLDKYEDSQGERHPNLKLHQWENIFDNITKLEYDYKEIILQGNLYRKIVDYHFDTEYKYCDYHLPHFVSGQVIHNRYQEVDRNEANLYN